jgi:dihydrodipicolinate synthase/N-acetylneuraminate lyase
MPEFLTGVIAPMLTALNEDRSLDETGNRSVIAWYKGTGVITTIFARSGVGQMFSFDYDQVKTFIDITTSEAKDEIHLLVGTSGTFPGGDSHTRPPEDKYIEETVELSRYAEEKGATGVVVLPLGLEPSKDMQDKIFAFYEKVHDAVGVPIMIYQPPGVNPPYSMTPDLLEKLSSLERIKGMKFSTSDMQRFGVLCGATVERDFTMIAGHEGAFLPAMVLGAGGVIGGGCNTHPEIMRAIFDAFMEGDLERARLAPFVASRLLGVRFGAPDPYSAGSLHASKLYLARKGVNIKPYHWGHKKKEADHGDEIEKAIDEAVASVKS